MTKYAALATDYDGTIARDGQVAMPTLQALECARARGLRLVMVTGRELTDLFKIFPEHALFDRIVAENGAVLYEAATNVFQTLAPPPPPSLLQALRQQGVPLSLGHSIVATSEPHQRAVLDAIRDLGLEWHVIMNKGSVMALPSGVTKSTGLVHALKELGVPPERTVAVGDAENDLAFLRICGLAVAVADALPAVKAAAHVVTAAADGAGVAELIDGLLNGRFDQPTASSPRR